MNGQRPLFFLAESNPRFICIKLYYRANNCGKYADGFYNSMIDDQEGHIPLPLIMFTCTVLCHALLEWQMNKDVHQKASKSKLNADRPDRLNLFNYKHDGGKNVSCCAAMGHKLFSSPGVADMYTFLMNTWNTLPESYQRRVYNNTFATVKCQMQQAENPTPAVVISIDTARDDNAIYLDYLSSEVVLAEAKIRSSDPNILIDNNDTDHELHFGMAGGSWDYDDEIDESDVRNTIPTVSRWWRPATEHERYDLGTSDVDGYEVVDRADADADEEEEASQADDGSTQNVEDSDHHRYGLGTGDVNSYECEDCDDVVADEEK